MVSLRGFEDGNAAEDATPWPLRVAVRRMSWSLRVDEEGASAECSSATGNRFSPRDLDRVATLVAVLDSRLARTSRDASLDGP